MTTEEPYNAQLIGLTMKEIGMLPASVLGPIIKQGHIESGAREPSDAELKKAIDVVRRGHYVPGIPRSQTTTQADLDDLFGS